MISFNHHRHHHYHDHDRHCIVGHLAAAVGGWVAAHCRGSLACWTQVMLSSCVDTKYKIQFMKVLWNADSWDFEIDVNQQKKSTDCNVKEDMNQVLPIFSIWSSGDTETLWCGGGGVWWWARETSTHLYPVLAPRWFQSFEEIFFCQERGADGGNVVAIAYLELTTWINMSALLSIGVENNILQKPWWPPQRRPPASFQGSGSLWDQARVGLPPMSSISGTAHLPNALHCIDCWSLVSNKHIDTPFGSESYSLWNGDCCTSQNSTDMKCCFSLISSYDFYQIFISDS